MYSRPGPGRCIWVMAIRWRATLSCRLPPRLSRCRTTLPDQTGTGAEPLCRAKAAFDRLSVAADPLTPERFLAFDDARLLAIGFSRQKARYGRALALAIRDGSLDLDGLGGLDDEAVRTALEAIPGIGRWTSTIYLLMVLGPHTARGNIPQAIEHSVDWQTGVLQFMREHHYTRIDTRPEQVATWTETVLTAAEALLSSKVDSWQTGVNRNVEGRLVRRVLGYNGNGAHFRRITSAVAANGYQELQFSAPGGEV